MTKILMIAVLAVSLAAPAFAAEMTKGSKSYQTRSNDDKPAAAAQTPEKAEDVSNIAPAAGDQMPEQKGASEGKTLREEMRLPRKH